MYQFVTISTLVCLLALCLVPATVATGQVQASASIDSFEYVGDGSTVLPDGEVILWHGDRHRFAVTVAAGPSSMEARPCIDTTMNGIARRHQISCRSVSLAANQTTTVTVTVAQWPSNLSGRQEVRVVLRSPDASTVLDSSAMSVTVLDRSGDLDGDGLQNAREASIGTHLRAPDSDDDGLSDYMEVRTYETSPMNADTDGDGLTDSAEIERHGMDARSADGDGDGLPDGRELAIGTDPNTPDTDGDGVDDAAEVNTYGTDPFAPDSDGDGLDDGAEIDDHRTNPTRQDTDGDGLTDTLELNTYESKPNNIDSDGDGLDDGAEIRVYKTDPTAVDSDDDGLTDGEEVNTFGTDPAKPDTDDDGLVDGAEVDRHKTNPSAVDTDGDGLSDRDEVRRIHAFRRSSWGSIAIGAVIVAATLAGIGYVTGRVPGLGLLRRFHPARSGASTGSDAEPAPEVDQSAGSKTVPVEFISNDERVLDLLDRHGGRMPQTEIVKETDWSKSKVSRVLSAMEDDDRIVKIDVGRGNIVARPEDIPQGTRPPIDK